MLILLTPILIMRRAPDNPQTIIYFIICIFIMYFYIYYKKQSKDNNMTFLKVIEDDIFSFSPFQIFLFFLITILIWLFIFEQIKSSFLIISTFFISYSIFYYLRSSKQHNITIWESIRNDLPSFSKLDIEKLHIVVFLVILFPLIFVTISLIYGMF